MSKEKETENIINEKLNSREFAFDEKAWAGMETLLDAQQRKRRVGFFWYFSASMFVVLVAGAAWFFIPTTDKKGKETELATAANQSATVLNSTATADTQMATIPTQMATAETLVATISTEMATAETQMATIPTQMATAETLVANISTEMATDETRLANIPTQMATAETLVATISTQMATTENEQDSAQAAEKMLSTDSASLAETAKNTLTAPGKETKNAWGVMAGTGYWFPYYSTIGVNDNKGIIGFTGGIYYQRAFSKHIELGVSAVYSSRGALNNDKTITNSEFGFGVENDKTTISPQTLHYLTIPLYLRFNITQRSHLLVGACYYRLLTTTSKITHTTENSFGVLESSTEKQTGEHAGFRKNDIAAFIGYELTLFDRMNTGLQFSYGFYDITQNSYNNIKGTDRNISLQLQLKYDLIRH